MGNIFFIKGTARITPPNGIRQLESALMRIPGAMEASVYQIPNTPLVELRTAIDSDTLSWDNGRALVTAYTQTVCSIESCATVGTA